MSVCDLIPENHMITRRSRTLSDYITKYLKKYYKNRFQAKQQVPTNYENITSKFIFDDPSVY